MSVTITDNTDKAKDAAQQAIQRALTRIGGKVERYAKALCPVGTEESTGIKGYIGGTLKNSIMHTEDETTTTVGTNVFYAPYVELGTGPNYTPPPEWMENNAERGRGIGKGFVHPRPFLRPAMADHLLLYRQIIENELKNV